MSKHNGHPDLSVVIPVYKAEGCLRELHRRLTLALGALRWDFETILVEDCGGGFWANIEDLAGWDSRVKGFKLSRTFRQTNPHAG